MYGSQNTVVGNSNLVGTRCSVPDIAVDTYDFKDFDMKLNAPCDLKCESGGCKGGYKTEKAKC